MHCDWRLLGVGVLVIGSLAQQGCTAVPPVSAALPDVRQSSVQVRLVNLAPNSPNLGLNVGARSVHAPVAFGNVGEYVDLPANQYDVALTMALGQRRLVIDSEWTDLSRSPAFTVLALDEMPRIQLAVLREAPQPAANQALIRLVNAIPDSTELNWLFNNQQTLAARTVYGDIVEYQAVSPGFISLILQTEGSSNQQSFNFDVRPGRAYTFYATGLRRSGRGVQLVQSEDSQPTPRL